MSSKADCPYCLGTINAEADVCQHCGREVGKLIKAYLRIRELEALMPQPKPLEGPIAIYIVIAVFYALATLLYWWDSENQLGPILAGVFHWVPAFAGLLIAVFSRSYNPVRFFALGFAQPVISIAAFVLFEALKLEDAGQLLTNLLLAATQTGLIFLVGGAIAVAGSRLLRSQVTFEPDWTGWLSSRGSNLERLEKWLLALSAVLTPVLSIYSLLKGTK